MPATKARGFTDFEEMLENLNLDAVFSVTPDPLHAKQALAALSQGIAAFFEM